jgi:hypothetical protein
VFEHKYIKLLDRVIAHDKGSFHLEPAFKASKLTKDEFEMIRDSLFYRENLPDSHEPASQSLNWKLKPEAVFQYLSYQQYVHAISSTKKALWVATASLVIATIGIVLNVIKSGI